MSDHYVIKCGECHTVITECECNSPNKRVAYAICPACQAPDAEVEATEDSDSKPVIIGPNIGVKAIQLGDQQVGINLFDMMRVLAATVSGMSASQGQGLILSALGSFTEMIDDEAWEKIAVADIVPCGDPGCECHRGLALLIPALDKLRDIAHRAKKREGE